MSAELRIARRRLLMSTAALGAGALAMPHVARAQGKPEKQKVLLAVGGKSALYYLSLTARPRATSRKRASTSNSRSAAAASMWPSRSAQAMRRSAASLRMVRSWCAVTACR